MSSERSVLLTKRILRFVFTVSAIFGVGDYLLDGRTGVKPFIPLRLYGLVVFTAFAAFFLTNDRSSNLSFTDASTTSLLRFEYIMYWLFSLGCLASSICNQNGTLLWIRRAKNVLIAQTASKLAGMHVACRCLTGSGFALLVFYVCVAYFGRGEAATSLLAYSSLYATVMVVLLQYIFAILFLYLLFRDLNDELGEMLLEARGMNMNNTFENLFFVEYGHFLKKGTVEAEKLSTIRKLSQSHALYCSMTGQLNDCFSLQLLFFTGLCFVELSYGIFCLTTGGYETDSHTAFSIIFFVTWLLLYLWLLLAYTVSTEMLVREGNKCGATAHKIINSENARSLKHELEIFSLQVHQSGLGVTALGIFQVDNTLLYEMAGSVTSAIVILIQFHKYTLSEMFPTATPVSYNMTTLL